MMLFLDAVPVVLPATTPFWLTLAVIFLCVAFCAAVGYLLYRQLVADARESEEEKTQPPERL